MPYRIGMLAYPVFLFLTVRQKNSAASKFLAAGAVSPETARRPSTLGIPQTLGLIQSGVRQGVLVAMEDGRYYVNTRVYRRRRNLLLGSLVGGSALFAGALAWLLLSGA
ncbi:MAG TPA: hypothetical protein VFF69_00270 [Phycisphaerales bacterium]|nr:hypothetical protein [Phycisphaerales bacterium]